MSDANFTAKRGYDDEHHHNKDKRSRTGNNEHCQAPSACASDLYEAAAFCLDQIFAKRCSLKTALYSSPYEAKRPLYGLLSKCMQNRQTIAAIVEQQHERLQIEADGYELSASMLHALIGDLLYGRLDKRCEWGAFIWQNRQAIVDARKEMPSSTTMTSAAARTLPRYVRVNRLRIDVDSAVEEFRSLGFDVVSLPDPEKKAKYRKYIESVKELGEMQCVRDRDVESLFVFHPSAKFFESEMYQKGRIVLQDKASCMAAYLLNPEPGSTVLDATAAPGMKTSFLADLMENKGTIIANDLSSPRMHTMRRLLRDHGVTCVRSRVRDFLQSDPQSEEMRAVEYILLDPSCSGSGIAQRHDSAAATEGDTDEQQDRLLRLRRFQTMMLQHALAYPAVKRIVYSTCSVYKEENECVVADALASDIGAAQFQLVDCHRLWRRGKRVVRDDDDTSAEPDPSFVIKMTPDNDLTNGFFIAVIERRTEQGDVES